MSYPSQHPGRRRPAQMAVALGAVIGLAGITAATHAQAQDIPAWKTVYSYVGTFPQARLGLVLAGVGDSDGDRRDDLLVGSIERLYIYSGGRAGYPTLWSLHGDSHNDFEEAVAVPIPDLDGDRRTDVVVGAPFASLSGGQSRGGGVYVYSSTSGPDTPQGKQLFKVPGPAPNSRFGAAVAVIGDVNGDNVPDIAVGAPGMTIGSQPEAGAVSVISGSNGTTLFFVAGLAPGPVHLGSAVAAIGDVNSDGVPDFAVGAPDASFPNRANAGVVFSLSGKNGQPLDTGREGPEAGMRFGASMADAGNVGLDKRRSLIVGAPGRTVNGQRGAGTVFVLTNLPFVQRLLRVEGSVAGDGLGTTVAGGGDVDGDGYPDILIGAPLADVDGRTDAGLVQVYSGKDGALLLNYSGFVGNKMGTAVAYCGDITGDSRTDIAVGAPAFEFSLAIPSTGLAFVLSLPGL